MHLQKSGTVYAPTKKHITGSHFDLLINLAKELHRFYYKTFVVNK